MFVSLVFSIINVVVNFPILFNLIVDVVLTPFIILRVDRFINSLPASYYWCQNGPIYPQPGLPQDQPIPLNCGHWKTVVTVLMAIIASFGGIIAYVLAFENELLANRLIVSSIWFSCCFEAFQLSSLGRDRLGPFPWGQSHWRLVWSSWNRKAQRIRMFKV